MAKGYVIKTEKSRSQHGWIGNTPFAPAMNKAEAERFRQGMIEKDGFDAGDVQVVEIDADYVMED